MSSALKAAVQDPLETSLNEVRNKNTGFPEPLSPSHRQSPSSPTKLTISATSDANTTLRHPDADTSQNASIEEKDISVAKAHSRHSSFQFGRSFNSRHKTTLSRGTVNPSTIDGMYDNIQYVDGTKERKSVDELTEETKEERTVGGVEAGTVATTPAAPMNGRVEAPRADMAEKGRDSQEHSEGERKRGMLKKFHLHK